MHPAPNDRLAAARADYATFLATYLPTWTPVPCADFHLRAAEAIRQQPEYQGVWQWFRGAAKSTHATVLLPLWLAIQEPPAVQVVLVVGRNLSAARRLLRDVRYALTHAEQLLEDTGWRPAKPWSTTELVLEHGPAFLALGMGQSPRGLRVGTRRPDFIVADDLDYPALVANPTRVHTTVAWILEDLLGTQDQGPARFLLTGNLFSSRSVQAELLATGRFDLHRVNALGEDGRPSWPAKYGDGAWLHRRRELLGYRAFAREYMNTPVEEGGLFRPHWIRYEPPLPWHRYAALVAYIDPSFTDSPRADYKACKLWGAYTLPEGGTAYHHLAAFVRQTTLRELFLWCIALYRKGQAAGVEIPFQIEANFFQALVLRELQVLELSEGIRLPIRPDRGNRGPKFSRIEAVSTLWERGLVAYAEELRTDPDTQTGIAQLLALAPGSRAHDDGPDADAAALSLLQRQLPTNASPYLNTRHLLEPRRRWR